MQNVPIALRHFLYAQPIGTQHEEILRYLDVLVDGEFQVDKLDVGLKWK